MILKEKIYKIENKKLHGSVLPSYFSNSQNQSHTSFVFQQEQEKYFWNWFNWHQRLLSFLRRSSSIPLFLGEKKEVFCADDLESSVLKENE